MAGNWMDDRDRMNRERAARGPGDGPRGRGDEERSWNRDRVFGERESGASYGRSPDSARTGAGGSRGWQDPGYGGVSPAMRQGAYGQAPRFTNQDYRSGGRFYGDDESDLIYREEYGQGGVEYGDPPSGYDAGGYSPTRARYQAKGYGEPGYGDDTREFRRDMNRPASGGTGGYDYERGYGDGGRRDSSRTERFEDAGRGAGEFLHRAGEKMAAWFGGGGESRAYEPGAYRGAPRGARGLGPQGYKRSDDRISDDAHDRLTDDTWLDASNIAISVSGGEVTLSGTVDSREAKHRAERLVEDLAGVTHVQNNLRVARGNPLTSPGSGYGDSVLGSQIRAADPSPGNGTDSGGASTTARKT
jgi:hypothetical protein